MRRTGRTMQMDGGHARHGRGLLASLLAGALGLAAVVGTGPGGPASSVSAAAPVGQGFNLNASDLRFILQQIKIAENHVATTTEANAPCGALLGPAPDQIPANGVGVTLPWGLRTVDGTCNNLLKDTSIGLDQNKFGAADQPFPRHVPAQFKTTPNYAPTGPDAPPVMDPEPRRISNLIVDQTPANPAATNVAGPDAEVVNGSYFIPNVATDTGLSAPYNSWFTLFGQFFDHGLDLVGKGGAGSVFVPLDSDDPLRPLPTGTPPFMILTRATHVDGEATNQTTPFVDQSQTYTSHPSHQVFLREYVLGTGGRPELTGRLITGSAASATGMADWGAVKEQARTVLGIELTDADVTNVPLIAADLYGHFLPHPVTGFPQLVLEDNTLVSGTPGNPITTAGTKKTGHAFLDDIAHHAVPGSVALQECGPGPQAFPGAVERQPDLDAGVTDDGDCTTYDDEMLDAHFIAGDGRVNENIGLTTVHHIFHSEHNRLVGVIDGMLHDTTLFSAAELADWQAVTGDRANWNYAERLFQAARFGTEMQYQHLAFEEFVRKVQPMVNLFGEGGTGYHTEINPAIRAEFAHAVYRFGHSMLTETVDRTDPSGASHDIDLLDAFLNPQAFFESSDGSPENAAGNVIRGMTRQVGNELDEFVTDALRNRLLGLPLDLPVLNISRARDTGIPGLNAARRAFYAESNNPALVPYTSWADFGFNLKSEGASLVNFIAAYGTHTTITAAGTTITRRAAAQHLLDIAGQGTAEGQDAYDFINSLGAYASSPSGITTTGVDDIDLWMGGLAEKQMVFGGLLGPTFNYVFENQMENLQDGDRFYYLSRTAGLNMLTQLEGNSFSELIMRNTDAEALPADSFSRPAFVFDVRAQNATGPIIDDPKTPEVNEALVLIRQPDGTIRYNGPEHVVFNGRDAAPDDRIRSSEGDDTLRGNGGNDHLEGGDGVDNLIGGLGDDFLTDLFGDDVLKGGDGNDYLSSGQGFGGDLNQGGRGDDFIVGGNDITETFAGEGNDFVFAGDAEDTVFGDGGDDWIEGGLGPFNLLQGDNGAPFGDDPNEPGHDVLDSDGGEQDFDAEGGDDIMFLGGGIQRAEGMLGFDWVSHRGDPSPGNTDMELTIAALPSVETNRDRMDRVEALSGWNFNDVLRGDSRGLGADPETGLDGHELTTEGIARINGLAALLPVGAQSFTGGNIILGGAGADIIEGRGGDDIIDGDRWLNAELSVGNTLYPGLTTGLRSAVAAGTINPGSISIFRSIVTPPPAPALVDVAVFSDVRNSYVVTENPNGSITVNHSGGTATDGIDTLWNIERLRFADGSVEFGAANTAATGTVAISDNTPTENQLLTVTPTIFDPEGSGPITTTWEAEIGGGWTQVHVGPTFTPSDGQVGSALRVVATFLDGAGVPEQVIGAATGPVTNVNDVPVGLPIISGDSPMVGVPLSVALGSITDADGKPPTLGVQWLRGSTPITSATGTTYVPAIADIGQTLRVRVTYTDLHGTAESLLSASTAAVVDAPPPPPAAAPPLRRPRPHHHPRRLRPSWNRSWSRSSCRWLRSCPTNSSACRHRSGWSTPATRQRWCRPARSRRST